MAWTDDELRGSSSAFDRIVECNIDGNGAADFSFSISDLTQEITPSGVNNDDVVL